MLTLYRNEGEIMGFQYETWKEIKEGLNENVTLVAVSKTYPIEVIQEAYDKGQTVFGENKVQELKSKAEILPEASWHLIGHLQTNKVKDAVKYACCIQSVDSLKLAKEINKQCVKLNKKMSVLVQINVSKEETKSGFMIEDIEEALKEINQFSNISLDGFMVIGPNVEDENKINEVFHQANMLFNHYQKLYPSLHILSMGMSDDYKIAIENGSNMIRVGSKLFGKRNYNL